MYIDYYTSSVLELILLKLGASNIIKNNNSEHNCAKKVNIILIKNAGKHLIKVDDTHGGKGDILGQDVLGKIIFSLMLFHW